MIFPVARDTRSRVYTLVVSFLAIPLFVAAPAGAQTIKETRVIFPSANANQNGYEYAGLDMIYQVAACGGGIHVGYAVEPGSLDVSTGYWYEGHRYAIKAGWPEPRTQSFAVGMNAKHGAETIQEWTKQDPATTNQIDCSTAVEFFYISGGWKALLGERANDAAARENALASISLNTPFEADRTLRNPEIETQIRREIEAAEAQRRAEAEQKAEAERKAAAERVAEEERNALAAREVEAARTAETERLAATTGQAEAYAADRPSDLSTQEALQREEALRRQEALEAQEAEERHAREVERQRVEAERLREEERQAAVNELGNTLEQGLLAGIAITGYTAMPAVAMEGVTQEFGLRFGQVGDGGAFLFGFGTNDLSMLSGGESASNQQAFTVGGEIGLAPRSLGLSRSFMPYLGTYYKSVEFYEDEAYDQEEESWETWGFNLGFMGVLGDILVYQAGLMGDLGTPEINYMRGGDAGFFLSLGFQLSK